MKRRDSSTPGLILVKICVTDSRLGGTGITWCCQSEGIRGTDRQFKAQDGAGETLTPAFYIPDNPTLLTMLQETYRGKTER